MATDVGEMDSDATGKYSIHTQHKIGFRGPKQVHIAITKAHVADNGVSRSTFSLAHNICRSPDAKHLGL